MSDDDAIKMARQVRDGGHWNQLDIINYARIVAAAERQSNIQAVRRALLSIDGTHGVTHGVWHIAQRVVDHCVQAIEERA